MKEINHRERPGQRSACDRCHGQKLRCIRGPPPNGACQRCIKARETCQYSPALRQGRPTSKQESKYGANDNGAKAQTNSALITATEDHGRRGADHVIDFSALGFPRGPIGDGQGIEAHGTLIISYQATVKILNRTPFLFFLFYLLSNLRPAVEAFKREVERYAKIPNHQSSLRYKSPRLSRRLGGGTTPVRRSHGFIQIRIAGIYPG